ncbi:MAG: hypothetical protein JXA94_06110 [Parachlamydiales bacterium]|nr:hypothetical protein [Parachlamydiales bacterium]
MIAARSRYDRGYYGRDRYRRGRGGGGFQFRFEIGPSERYYYSRPYYDFVTLNCEILDDENTKVTQVQIGDSVIYLDRANNVRRYYFSLRPGYYTIRWRVFNEKFFGAKYRNYSRNLRVERGRYQIDVTIIGKNIYIR